MDIGKKIQSLDTRLAKVERSARLSHAAIDNTAVVVKDGTGGLRGIIGLQSDGTTAVNIVNGAAPPQPSAPVVTSVLGGVKAAWDGTFAAGAVLPLDWQRVEVHASTSSGFTPDATTLRGTIETPQGAELPVITSVPVYVRLLARNTSGTASAPSTQAGPFGPTPVVADSLLDGIVTTVKLADDAVTAAKVATGAIDVDALHAGAVTAAAIAANAVTATAIADGAVGTTEISDGAISTPKLVANAVTANELAANAVTAAKIAAGAVVAGKLDAASVTAGNIAAAAVQAGNLAAAAVQAGNVAADAIQAGNIAANAVTAREIAALTITAAQIAANTITATNLAAGSVDATALSATAITGKTITGGTITGTTITGATVTGGTIQTAASGEHITLNEAGANKVLVYNSSNVAIGELSARGLLLQGTTGAIAWIDPSAALPQLRFDNASGTNTAYIQMAEVIAGDANLQFIAGKFTADTFTDRCWRQYMGNDFAIIERIRRSVSTANRGGRLNLRADYAEIGYMDSASLANAGYLRYDPGIVTTMGRHTVTPQAASSSDAFSVNALTGHTGNLLRAQLNTVDKFTVDKDGNVTTAGNLTVSGIGQRSPKRRSSNDTRTSTITPTNDTQITWTVDANAVYAIEGVLFYSGPGDFLMGWSYPTGSAGTWNGLGNGTTVVSGTGGGGTQQDISSSWGYTMRSETTDLPDTRTYGGIATTSFAVHVRGTVRIGSTGGTFALRWAQGTSNATATTLYIDSRITLEKIG